MQLATSLWGEEKALGTQAHPFSGWTTSGLTGLQLPDHLVAGVTGPGPFLGLFGLGPGLVPTDDSTSYPGAMQDLMDRAEIPSRSFGYTAGAYYSKSVTQRYIYMADSFLTSSTKFQESHTRWL